MKWQAIGVLALPLDAPALRLPINTPLVELQESQDLKQCGPFLCVYTQKISSSGAGGGGGVVKNCLLPKIRNLPGQRFATEIEVQ